MADDFLNYFSDKEKDKMKKFAASRTALTARLLPILNWIGVSPDCLSFVGFSLLITVGFTFTSYPLVAASLIATYVLIDGVDGSYARLTNTATQGGALTDIVCDQLGLVVVGVCSIYHGLINPSIGAYYIVVYMIMIALSVSQNAMGAPMQTLLRSKYIFYVLYLVWGITGRSYMTPLAAAFSFIHTITCIQSFFRIKKHLDSGTTEAVKANLDSPDNADEDSPTTPPNFTVSRRRDVSVVLVFVVLNLAVGTVLKFNLVPYFFPRRSTADHSWTTLSDSPGNGNGYPPQGMATDGKRLYLATHWNDTKTRVHVLNAESLTEEAHFDMPESASHTSGLAWDGKFLWAVDFNSLRAYKIDLDRSLETEKAVVVASFHTGLKGASACCIAEHDGRSYLVISDFMNSQKTIVLDPDLAVISGVTSESMVASYTNQGFSQGLTFKDGYLYEAENKHGPDVVCKYDFDAIMSGSKTILKEIIPSPCEGIEDMAVLNGNLYTSDEVSFKVYKLELSP